MALLLTACGVSQAAWAEDKFPQPVTFTPGCAPWDGPTYEMTLPLKGEGVFKATVWGAGLEALKKGEVVVMHPDDIGDHTGNGYASFCPDGAVDKTCLGVKASIHVPGFPGDPGSDASRLIFSMPGTEEEKSYRIETHIADDGAECG